MGAWGEWSYDCDSVMDYVDNLELNKYSLDQDDEDEDLLTQEKVDKAIPEIKEILNNGDLDDDFDKSDALGLVTYILSEEKILPDDILEIAEQLCVELVTTEHYLKQWNDPKLRETTLIQELDSIRTAIEKNGLRESGE